MQDLIKLCKALQNDNVQGQCDLIKAIEQYTGQPILGWGCKAIVFEMNSKVYKLLHRADPSYQLFADYCQQNSSEHLPKISGPHLICGYTCFQLEKLKPARGPQYDAICAAIDPQSNPLNVEPLKEPIPQTLLQLVEDIKGLTSDMWEVWLDLSTQNIMLNNDNQIIITDPIS